MVQSAINQQMSDRINSMAQTILSRTTLTTIINTFALYPRERSRMPIEDVIELMKKKIEILPVVSGTAGGSGGERVPAFAVRFSYENRFLAQRVVQDVVSRFIDENIRNRSNATFQTTTFIRDELDSAKKELDAAENKVAAFRMQNNGRLPDQMDANMRSLTALQAQVSYLDSQVSRAQQDKLQIESNLRIMKDQLAGLTKDSSGPASAAAVVQAQRNSRLADQDREIQGLEKDLNLLRQHYKDTYPDVQAAVVRLASARKRRDEMEAEEAQAAQAPAAPEAPVAKTLPPAAQREARDMDANIRRMQASLEAKDLEIQTAQKEMKRVADAVRNYQGRIETVPLGEKQYADMLRDRDLAKEKVVDLTGKLDHAQIAQEMEGRKQGETLELLDPGFAPDHARRTEAPDRDYGGRGARSDAGPGDRRGARDEGHFAQESEGRAGLHQAGNSGQRTAAGERLRGAPPAASRMARVDHGVSGGRGRNVGIGGLLLRDESLNLALSVAPIQPEEAA